MDEISDLSINALMFIVGIVAAYFAIKGMVKGVKQELKLHKEISIEKDKQHDDDIKDLRDKMELKANETLVTAIRQEVKNDIEPLRKEIRTLNQNLIQFLSTKQH